MKKFIQIIKKHWQLLVLLILLGFGFYLRLYGLENYSQFGWDQVDNAWAAKNILVDHKILLNGMVAKGNSGIYVGPLYYYAIAVFYYFTHLDPIASIFFAALTSVFSAFVLFFVTKKLFSIKVAFIALFIQIVSLAAITFDRVQWPVDSMPAVSLLVLYFLYRVITGHEKSLIWLGLVLGISFHIHFTVIYFPLLVLLSLPFFPKTKKTLLYGFMAIGIVLIFLIPSFITFLANKSYGSNVLHYGSSSYHGVHLRRILQLASDAFIQFVPYLYFNVPSWLRILFLPIFIMLYWTVNKTKKPFKLLYLFGIWFIVPWVVLSAYSGELTDYYFSSTRFVALIIFAYLMYHVFFIKRNVMVVCAGMTILVLYAYVNLSYYFTHPADRPLALHRAIVKQAIKEGRVIQFTEGDPDSYLYYLYTKQ